MYTRWLLQFRGLYDSVSMLTDPSVAAMRASRAWVDLWREMFLACGNGSRVEGGLPAANCAQLKYGNII